MTYYFPTVDSAKEVAFGILPAVSLVQYYEAWQYLYDSKTPLNESDSYYMDKLICDGSVLTTENYNELGGIPYIPYGVGAWREVSLLHE